MHTKLDIPFHCCEWLAVKLYKSLGRFLHVLAGKRTKFVNPLKPKKIFMFSKLFNVKVKG